MTLTTVSRSEVNGTYTKTPLPWSTPAPHVLNGIIQSRPVLPGANARGCVVTFESGSLCNYSRCKHVYTTERGASPSRSWQAFYSSLLVSFVALPHQAESRCWFWGGFKGCLHARAREWSAVSGAAAATSWLTQSQSWFTEQASTAPCDCTK